MDPNKQPGNQPPADPPPPYYGPHTQPMPPPGAYSHVGGGGGGTMPIPPPFGPTTHPPPPGGVPVFPMARGPGESIPVTTVVMGPQFAGQVPAGVTVINVAKWGPHPMTVHCPNCQNQVVTSTNVTPGLLTYLLSGALIVLGCFWGCCLIPCCIPECQDVEHACPNCKQHLGTFRRM